MIRLTTENTARAIERCKQLKPKVRFISDRQFAVSSANNANVYERLKLDASYQNLDFVFASEVGTPIQHENFVRRHFKPALKKS